MAYITYLLVKAFACISTVVEWILKQMLYLLWVPYLLMLVVFCIGAIFDYVADWLIQKAKFYLIDFTPYEHEGVVNNNTKN